MSLISIHSPQDIAIMTKLGQICANLFDTLEPHIKPGITTKELDDILLSALSVNSSDPNLAPAFKGYLNYPAFACISVNEEIVHCIPSNRRLKEGDIVTVDLGVKTSNGVRDWNSDTAKTYLVGSVTPEVKAFVDVGYKALLAGIAKAIPGNHVNDISEAIGTTILNGGYGIVKQFVGHGIGKNVHEDPRIPNFAQKEKGAKLEPGMIICIEPILTIKPDAEYERIGEWNIITKDGSWATHWEHMVLITPKGNQVLTKRSEETF